MKYTLSVHSPGNLASGLPKQHTRYPDWTQYLGKESPTPECVFEQGDSSTTRPDGASRGVDRAAGTLDRTGL